MLFFDATKYPPPPPLGSFTPVACIMKTFVWPKMYQHHPFQELASRIPHHRDQSSCKTEQVCSRKDPKEQPESTKGRRKRESRRTVALIAVDESTGAATTSKYGAKPPHLPKNLPVTSKCHDPKVNRPDSKIANFTCNTTNHGVPQEVGELGAEAKLTPLNGATQPKHLRVQVTAHGCEASTPTTLWQKTSSGKRQALAKDTSPSLKK